jgi:hypothetical protein
MMKRLLMFTLTIPLFAYASPPLFSLTDTQGRTHTVQGHHGQWALGNPWAT